MKLLYTFSRFSDIQLFKPRRNHAEKSSFYLVAKNVQPKSEEAIQAINTFRRSWCCATFRTDQIEVENDELDGDDIVSVLAEFGPAFVDLARPIWAIQAAALGEATWMSKQVEVGFSCSGTAKDPEDCGRVFDPGSEEVLVLEPCLQSVISVFRSICNAPTGYILQYHGVKCPCFERMYLLHLLVQTCCRKYAGACLQFPQKSLSLQSLAVLIVRSRPFRKYNCDIRRLWLTFQCVENFGHGLPNFLYLASVALNFSLNSGSSVTGNGHHQPLLTAKELVYFFDKFLSLLIFA